MRERRNLSYQYNKRGYRHQNESVTKLVPEQAVIIDTQNKKAFIARHNESADSTTTITH